MTSVVDGFASRLANPSLDAESKLLVTFELRDSVELHQVTADYGPFVSKVVPEMINLLNSVPISFSAQSSDQKLRKALLDVLTRIPTTEPLKPLAADILKLVMSILRVDNEENGILCMKVLTNLHKAYKAHVIDQVQPFFDLVIDLFKNIPGLVNELFNQPSENAQLGYGTPASADTPGGSSAAQSGSPSNHELPIPRAMYSFKVLTECPIIIVLLYANHKQIVNQALPIFVPHIIETLSVEAAPQAKEHEAAASKGEIYTGVSPAIKNRAAYNDFIIAQIKIMSFLAYALRAFSGSLQNYYNLIPNFVVRLLKDCPAELSSARKELLVSMRHILSTYFRTFFISKVDVLLEERVLIGVGFTAQETLWPLAYSTMADLIHHVRNELSVSQIWKAVNVYCKNLHNSTLATSFQIMSAKLLLNFMERVMGLPERQEGRQIMVVILRAYVDRFSELNRAHMESQGIVKDKNGEDISLEGVLRTAVIKVHADSPSDDLKDSRYIFKNLMSFLKTVMFGFKSCNPLPPGNGNRDAPAQWQETARGLTYDDINLFRRLFREALTGQIFFSTTVQHTDTQNDKFDSAQNPPIVASKEEKELMEAFAALFIHIDPATFPEIVEPELEFYYQALFKNPALLNVAQLFLGSETTSANFSEILLRFLKKKLPELGDGDTQKSNILIRLFKLCFMAVNLFPTTNEAVMLPYFKDFIVDFLNPAANTKEPMAYFHLLRALFRSIGGGRFESLYKAVLPLLQVVLETLNRRLEMARIPAERDLYTELVLTVPVRLSLLVPHLSYMMRPLVLALNGTPELVTQGLRTLELCVDNLTASYFDPIIAPVLDDVMAALWRHLKPLPYNHQHSHTTLRILGKLGGRNRSFLTPPKDLDHVNPLNQDVSVLVSFTGLGKELPLRITPGVEQALAVLQNPNSELYYRRKAFEYLSVIMKQFIDRTEIGDVESYARTIEQSVDVSADSTFENSRPLKDGSDADITKRNHANDLCEKLLEAIFLAASVESLREEATALVKDLCEQFTLLELGEFSIEKRRAMRPFNLDDNEGLPHIEPRTILPAILFALSHHNSDIRELGIYAIRTIYETGKTICGPGVEVYRYPMIRSVFSRMSHGCFEEPYYRKAGACLGMKFLLQELDISLAWLKARQVELVRTIFFVIKDVSNDAPSSVRDNASELLFYLIERCNQDVAPESIHARPFTLLSSLLAYELESANSAVREISKKALTLLSEVIKQPLTNILAQVTNVFLNPIFGKPLRALPFPMQIGYIDAVSFSLELPDTFLRFNDKLTRLLEEALALVAAEDDSLTSAHRALEYSTSQQLIELRVVCIRLLSLALTTSDHLATNQPQMRAKIITVFFKTLTSSAPKAVDAAHNALKAVLSQNSKLPKDLLQVGLRPILVNLNDYSKLNVRGLDSLARLLELLTYYFKVEVGNKLLDHLRAWTDNLKRQPFSNRDIAGDESVQLAVAILNVFHLLPPAADMFIPDIMSIMVFIESIFRRVQSSPLREPVLKFLERHVGEAFTYFRSKLVDPQYGRLFVDFLNMKGSDGLREYTRENIDQLRQEIMSHERPEDKCVAICNLIFVLQAVSGDHAWLVTRKAIIENLISSIGDLLRITTALPTDSPLHMEIQNAVEELEAVVVLYFETSMTVPDPSNGDYEMLMMLISSLANSGVDFSPKIVSIIFNKIVTSEDVELRRFYLDKAFEMATKGNTHQSARLFLMKNLVRPVLIVESRRSGDLGGLLGKVGTGGWLDAVNNTVWKRASESSTSTTIDKYQFALLEMSVLLVSTSPQLITDARKDVIKFGWSFVKHEDIISKISAYVLASYFVAVYDSLPKIVLQIYSALLKTHQSEAKTLVNQALDVLAPVLTKRVKGPTWAKWPRKILAEDGHNVVQVTNIYLFISRHPDLFYEYREHFVPFIVSAMAKLSYMPNVHTDIELAELLATWEKRAAKEREESGDEDAGVGTGGLNDEEPLDGVEQKNDATVGSLDSANGGRTGPSRSYRMQYVHRETVVTYLVRYVCTLPQRATESPMGKRVLVVLDTLLSPGIWDDIEVRLNFFDRSLMQGDFLTQAAVTAGLNALEVVRITLKHKSKEWIQKSLGDLGSLLERSLRSSAYDIHKALALVLNLIFSEIDSEAEESLTFVRIVLSSIQDHLSGAPPAIGWVYLAREVLRFQESALNALLPGAIKSLGRVAKEIIDTQTANAGAPGSQATNANLAPGSTSTATSGTPASTSGARSGNEGASAPGATQTPAEQSGAAAVGAPGNTAAAAAVVPKTPSIDILIDMLDLIGSRVSHLGDQRRVYLSIVAQLIERVHDRELALHIIEMVRAWVFSRTELFPTLKEKAALIHKLLSYDSRKDPELTEKYYSIVIGVFEDDHLSKTELPARLEQPFLMGTTIGANEKEVIIRNKLLGILSGSLEKGVIKRLAYVFMEQNWEAIGDQYWLNEALQLLYGSSEFEMPLQLSSNEFHYASFDIIKASLPIQAPKKEDADGDTDMATLDEDEKVTGKRTGEDFDGLVDFVRRREKFVSSIAEIGIGQFIQPLAELQYLNNDLAHSMWVNLFPELYKNVPLKERHELVQGIVVLLAKEYHTRQADQRPNVIRTILDAIAKVEHLPPQLVKYLAGNYGAWYQGIEIMEKIQSSPNTENPKVAESNLDALTELYASLQENDMFYGLWRTRSKFIITSSALSYEQCGMWNRAMQMHETAQIKARSGVLPYGESEYGLWEDHWILCAEKLQHWDILTELAKHEGFNDLLLECGWRVADWITDKEPLEQSIKSLMDVPTPRRQVFETFLCLQGFAQKTETIQTLSKYVDEGIQLALRKWHGLPQRTTGAHIPLLHTFQQYVEFMEASQIYTSLASTTSLNLEHKSQELKGVLQAWHERLPNKWDDINIWSDLVTWRQHVFGVINKVFLPLIPAVQQSTSNSSSSNSAAYRGYHEIAWAINRFAHVARKHQMTDVCINLLSKIYTLPNIEVQEAFLKLREQAKCHYQNPNDVSTGLEVISNTNFAFFGAQQKSEFFTLRGMSLAKLGAEEHANEQFATAVQLDVYLPHAWAEWGRFNDRRFKEHPEEIIHGSTAVSCYLQAAGLYKNAKSRNLLGRILWLLSLDDSNGTIASAFTNYRGEVPVWYWVTYIPQLLTSLAQSEAPNTSRILERIAKSYPQALHFHLRTMREEYAVLQRQSMQAGNRGAQLNKVASGSSAGGKPVGSPASQSAGSPAIPSPVIANARPASNPASSGGARTPDAAATAGDGTATTEGQKQPWEYVDEIMAILKTAYPLLALSLETLVDQIYHRFKSPPDEDAYRLIVALLNDGVQYMGRLQCPKEDAKLPPATEASISRFAEGVLPKHIKASFEADFVTDRPNLETYVKKLRKWRNRFEAKLDARPNRINLEALSPPLSEFHYQKFEEIEVPGQNQELKDSNIHFVKIGRFLSNVDVVRGFGVSYRRLTIRGRDGSTHPFAVQYPAARHCRREERVAQLFKILNNVLSRRKESRSRHLQFTLPTAVPLNTHIRLVQDNASYVSFYQIYEKFCREHGQSRDAPFEYTTAKMRAAFDPRLPKPDIPATKMEILSGIQSSLVPPTIMRDYFTTQYRSFEDFWLFRKQFAYQYAGITFMTVMMSINNRYPHKFLVNMDSGNLWALEMLPQLAPNKSTPTFVNGEPVAFRLTPNIQTLLGPTVLEGLYGMAVMIIAKGLTEPEFDLSQYLPVFVRDELLSWYTQQQRRTDGQFRDIVRGNVDNIVKRATSLAQIGQGNIPANQTVIDLISMAVNPRNLALTDVLWMPYY